MPVKTDGSVREIMNDTNAVLLRKTDRLLEKRLCRHSAGRIIRIIEIQQLRLAPHLFRNYAVIREKPSFFRQRHHFHSRFCKGDA